MEKDVLYTIYLLTFLLCSSLRNNLTGVQAQAQFSFHILEPLLHLLISLLVLRLRSSPALCDLSDGILPSELRQYLLHSENEDMIQRNEQQAEQASRKVLNGVIDDIGRTSNGNIAVAKSSMKMPSTKPNSTAMKHSPEEQDQDNSKVLDAENRLKTSNDSNDMDEKGFHAQDLAASHIKLSDGANEEGLRLQAESAPEAPDFIQLQKLKEEKCHTPSCVAHVLSELTEFYRTGMCRKSELFNLILMHTHEEALRRPNGHAYIYMFMYLYAF